MASIIAGTWSLISSSAEVVSKARGMTLGIHKLLQPEAVDLSEGDRRRLIGLQRRVQCMVQPLNFLRLGRFFRGRCLDIFEEDLMEKI